MSLTGLTGMTGLGAIVGAAGGGGGGPTFFGDNFDDNALAPMWAVSDPAFVVEQNGRLEITGGVQVAHTAAAAFDFEGHHVEFKLAVTTGRGWARLILGPGNIPGDLYLEVRANPSGNLQAGHHTADAGDQWAYTAPYDPVAHAWIQFKHNPVSGNLEIYTSPDGAAWVLRSDMAPPNGATHVAAWVMFLSLDGGSVTYFDDLTSDIPV